MVSFMPRPLYPREGALRAHWIGGWVDPRTGLDDLEKRKFMTLPGLKFRPLCRPACSQSLYRLRYPDYAIPASCCNIKKIIFPAKYIYTFEWFWKQTEISLSIINLMTFILETPCFFVMMYELQFSIWGVCHLGRLNSVFIARRVSV
jgi:hypothetical protein